MNYILAVEQNPYASADGNEEDTQCLFNMDTITFTSGLNVITGCNGYGKTTLIDELEEDLNSKDIEFISYKNNIEGRGYFEKSMLGGDIAEGASFLLSSEGEQIVINLMKLMKNSRKL